MAKLVNLTPHIVNLFDMTGEKLLVNIEPTAPAARCSVKNEKIGEADGVPLFASSYGEVIDLPEPQEDTIFIVSLVVRQALPNRTDLASPGELIRDSEGKPIGAKGLAMNQASESPAEKEKPSTFTVGEVFLRRALKYNHVKIAESVGMDVGDYAQDAYLQAIAEGRTEDAKKMERLMLFQEQGVIEWLVIHRYEQDPEWVKFYMPNKLKGITKGMSLDEAIAFATS